MPMQDSTLIAAALDDRYVIERELGAGGMAVVYLARDRKLDREVALKVLRPELGAVLGSERFLTEIKISARLDHPHILTLIDSGDANGFLYYVLPYVRGESLRDKIDREHQLGIDEALTITKQVASALDYAHRQHLVHRDIKPENILLQEGEAMLADFGIALAIKEAGGNRLTQTGLSLGTPQYMSPEQATGDRGIDARSDVYSLAAVLYEMLAGEPPVTGSSAQSMIAKLMTETPTHLRVLRNTVSPELDAAVAKALSKTPADRFNTAGEFSRALDVKSSSTGTTASAAVAKPANRRRQAIGAVTVVAIAAALTAVAMRPKPSAPASLGTRTQLTSTGAVLTPAISPDGKQLAFLTRQCKPASCTVSVVVQDVGGTTTRTLLDGATAGYGLEWSPDRRNLIFAGTLASRSGAYLLSALGGEPRFLGNGVATFYAGGDSLLLGPALHPDSVFYVRVAGLNGVVHDSIPVVGPGQSMEAISNVPGTTWILTLVTQRPHGLWQIVDRSGKVADRVVNACTCGGIATSDAVWLARAGDGLEESVVRIAIDRESGHFSARQDTMAHGVFTGFSLTSDGGGMVMDDGTFDHGVWALPLDDAIKGTFPDERRIAHASSAVVSSVSPDGARVILRRTVPTTGGHSEVRLSTMPFDGGAEAPLAVPGAPLRAVWVDAQYAATMSRMPSGLHFAEVNVSTGATRNVLDTKDSVIRDYKPLADGWAWIPPSGDRIVAMQNGRRREFKLPEWYGGVASLLPDRERHRLMYLGWGRATGDSLGMSVISLDDGSQSQWVKRFVEDARLGTIDGHDALLQLSQAQDSWSLYALDGPEKLVPLGTIPRPAVNVSVSSDLKRAVVSVRDYRADAWISKVIRP